MYWKKLSFVLAAALCCLPVVMGQNRQRVTKEQLSVEGKRELRDLYFQNRKLKPGDTSFDPGKARYEAIQLMKQQRAARGDVGLNPWVPFGPAPTTNGQTPTSTPRFPSDVSGRVTAIAIDDTDNAVFIGGAQGGVWRSNDNGASWTPLFEELDSTAIGSIAIDPAPHAVGQAVVYVGTGEGNGTADTYGGVGVYKSIDSGNTWTGPFGVAEFTNRGINSIAVDRNDPDHLFCTTQSGVFGVAGVPGPTTPMRGLFESTDGGLTWTHKLSGNNPGSVVLQDPVTPTTWWAALWFSGAGSGTDNGGLLRSIDNGANWTQVGGTGGLPAVNGSWSRAWVTATSDNGIPENSVIYVANGQSNGSVFKSVDSGANWTAVPAATGYCAGQCFYDMPIYVEPGDPDVFYTGGAGTSAQGVIPSQFMRSDNGGASFADKVRSDDMSNALHADVHAITSWPGQPNRLWTGNDGGIWRSDNRGDTWINVNSNLALTQFTRGDLDPTDPDRVYGGTQDNGTMGRDGANEWPHLDFGDGGFALIDQGNPNNLVHTYFNITNALIGVGFTTNGFATTQGFYNGSFAPANGISFSDRVLFYAPIHFDRGVSDTLYFGTHRLWRADNFFINGGAGGEFVSPNPAQSLATTGAISAIETVANGIRGANASTIFTGASNGDVFRSTDAGANWTQVDVGGSGLFVSDILVDPNNTSLVYRSLSGFSGSPGQNVRKSIDGGTTWTVAGTGLPDIPVNALAFDPATPTTLWAGTDIGAYFSTDGGDSWVPHNDGLPTVAIHDLKSNPTTNRMVAFTHGRSTFLLDFESQCFGTPTEAINAILASLGNGDWPQQQTVLDYTDTLNNVCPAIR